MSRRKSAQKGSALIEFALSATLLITLAIGAVTFGLAVQQGIVVADAANAGALFGANGTYYITYTGGMQIVSWVAAAEASNFTATASYFCECTAGGSVVSCSSACGTDQPLYYVKVIATETYTNPFRYLGLPSTFTLQSTTVMPVQ
jgi:Flp pilus assembly protein TadG